MTEKRYKPIGGVLAARLYTLGTATSLEEVLQGEAVEVELEDDGSLYEEKICSVEGLVSVQHTLTLCSDHHRAAAWFGDDFLARCAAEGVVAEVRLATDEHIVVGWSERFALEQALRLESLDFRSGTRPNDSPQVRLTLVSKDTRSAIV